MANIYSVTKVVEQPSKIFVTNRLHYLAARRQADEWAQETGLVVASMPQLAQALKSAETRALLRPEWFSVDSAEYHGVKDGDQIYVVAHGMGPFSRRERLGTEWKNMTDDGFMPIYDDEWQDLLKDAVHLGDLKRGAPTGDKFAVYVRRNKDKPIVFSSGLIQFWESVGNYNIMADDIAIMRAGSEGALKSIVDTLLGEKLHNMGNYHVIGERGFGQPPVGRPLYLGADNRGFNGVQDPNEIGQFIGVEGGKVENAQEAPLENRV